MEERKFWREEKRESFSDGRTLRKESRPERQREKRSGERAGDNTGVGEGGMEGGPYALEPRGDIQPRLSTPWLRYKATLNSLVEI